MEKPEKKRKVAVSWSNKGMGVIRFYASADVAKEFEGYGDLKLREDGGECRLIVDPRYDFDDVLSYLQNYG